MVHNILMTSPPRAARDPRADDVAAADGGRVVDRVESLDEDLAGVLRLALRASKDGVPLVQSYASWNMHNASHSNYFLKAFCCF